MDAPTNQRFDVIVVGGGLAGLTAATVAARAGRRVRLLEARVELGGRARSEHSDGFVVNQGAHALYRAGAALPILRELGVKPRGHTPRQRSAQWVQGDQLMPLRRLKAIGGVRGLGVIRPLLSARAARAARGQSLVEWLDRAVEPARRPFAEMLIRTSTYSTDFAHTDAGAALDQVRRGAHNVLYLHGGWSSLVEGLRDAALAAGVEISHERATRVEPDGGTFAAHLDSGPVVAARAIVLAAGGAAQAHHLLGDASPVVAGWAERARPVRAACLDLSLRTRPERGPVVAYGLGEPIYLVDHSASVRVAPDGSALVQCLYYEPDLVPGVDHRARLEAAMDCVQPGWRDALIDARFSRRLVVAHDRPQPGLMPTDRPRVTIEDQPGVFVAGDWVTADGLLADAAVSSGRTAGLHAAGVADRHQAVVPSLPVGR